MKYNKCLIIVVYIIINALSAVAYTRADTLRGSNGTGRRWWDVQRYQLHVNIDPQLQVISGSNQLLFKVTEVPDDSMQIDLQEPMLIDSAVLITDIHSSRQEKVRFVRDGNVWWMLYPFSKLKQGETYSLLLHYHGSPRKAVNPPWDGGISWKKDTEAKPWVAVSCQGLGASVWWPCKDAQWDEPEKGVQIALEVPKGMIGVSNGRMVSTGMSEDNNTTVWEVQNPINNYNVTFYAGNYVHWHDTLMGEKGKLDLDYYVLKNNEKKAKEHFVVVKQMIHCFEYWMGPYPFYEDGYKLVEAPYLGMEHQSAIAYGNDYKMGYKGIDRSMTGHGLKWDYIIVHESGHEWFGNNVTAADMADNWVHEGVTSYSEALFTECLLGKEKAAEYSRGLWHSIKNEQPVVAAYGVNEEGTSDIYEKGAAVMHMIRVMTGNDEKFRKMLRGLGIEFYHGTVTTQQVEQYIAAQTGLKLDAFFDQYLRTAEIPKLEYYIKNNELNYRFEDAVVGFSLPLTINTQAGSVVIKPTTEWQKMKWTKGYELKVSKDYLLKVKK